MSDDWIWSSMIVAFRTPHGDSQGQFVASPNHDGAREEIGVPVGLLVVGGKSGLGIDDPGRFGSSRAEQRPQRPHWHTQDGCDRTMSRSSPRTAQELKDVRQARGTGGGRSVPTWARLVADRAEAAVHSVDASGEGHTGALLTAMRRPSYCKPTFPAVNTTPAPRQSALLWRRSSTATDIRSEELIR